MSLRFWFLDPTTPGSHSNIIVTLVKGWLLFSGPMTFGLKLRLLFFLSLKVWVMVTRSCLHNTISLFHGNKIEASGREFKISCPILLFHNEMAYTGCWLRDFIRVSFHPWPQFRSAVIRPWVLAFKLTLKYFCSYSKSVVRGLILRAFVLVIWWWDLASELLM